MITSFAGPEHGFLSNFAATPFYLPGQTTYWKTAEHCFQAVKAPTMREAERIASADSPAEAKRLGRSVELPAWWDDRKRAIMLQVVLAKFTAHGNASLRDRLIATRPATLVEGNTWGDSYWGAIPITHATIIPPGLGMPPTWDDDKLYGFNWLGRILMMVREVL